MKKKIDTNSVKEKMPYEPPAHDPDRLLEYEYDTLIEEYRKVNTQGEHWIEADEKGFELFLVAIGATVVASSFLISEKVYSLFLILSLPFHVMTWIQIRRGIVSNHLANYSRLVLSPRLKSIIKKSDAIEIERSKKEHFGFWEEYVSTLTRGVNIISIAMALPHIGRTLLQFTLAVILSMAYFLFRAQNQSYQISTFDNILIGLNIVVGFASLISLLAAIKFSRQVGAGARFSNK